MNKDIMWMITSGNNTYAVEKLMACNEYLGKFGLKLDQDEVNTLITDQRNSLKEAERIEFGQSVMEKILFTFCDSPYIYQDNLVSSMGGLTELFYAYKTLSMDEVADDELLTLMKELFDGICQGSLEYLGGTCLDRFARQIREGKSFDQVEIYEE